MGLNHVIKRRFFSIGHGQSTKRVTLPIGLKTLTYGISFKTLCRHAFAYHEWQSLVN